MTSMTTPTNEEVRRQFEAAMRELWGDEFVAARNPACPDDYDEPAERYAWIGYQAALSAQPAPLPADWDRARPPVSIAELQAAQPAERQGEAVAKVRHFDYRGIARNGFSQEAEMLYGAPIVPDGTLLYTHPAAPVGVPDGMVPADAMRDLYRAYVRTLEAGHDRITSLGGDCDSVEHMERTDPALIVARRILAAAPSAPQGEG